MRGTRLLLPPREITVYWIDGGRRRWLVVSPRWDDQGSSHSQALGKWLSAAGGPLSRLGVGGEGIIGVELRRQIRNNDRWAWRGPQRKEKKRKDGKGVHDFGAVDFACGHAADL